MTNLTHKERAVLLKIGKSALISFFTIEHFIIRVRLEIMNLPTE